MAIKTKEEILEIVKTRIGDDSSEEALSFIEDITDTLEDKDRQIADSGDWKSKYDELTEKYKERFFSGDGGKEMPDPEEGEKKVELPTRFEDLFVVKED